MDDQGYNRREAKEQVIRLIDGWIERTGLKRQSLAALAGFPEYNHFYKAYLDTRRPVGTDPDRTFGVLRSVTTNLPRERRATTHEVLRFLAATRFPFDRLGDIEPLLDPHEWNELWNELPHPVPNIAGAASAAADDALSVRIAQLEAAIQDLHTQGDSVEDPLAAAAARLASIPDVPADPAPLPIPHRMPLIRGRLFTGRDAELRALIRLLRDEHADQVIAITGLGGVGKTSLASELVHRCGQFFAGGVFWISCAQPQTVAWEVAACGETGLVQHAEWADLPIEERARLVSLAWQEPVPRLLVFDSCEDDLTLRRWRPTSGGCRVVLTSQRARWSRGLGMTTLALGELSAEESITLLCGYRLDLAPDDTALADIARELGGLPLALHLAGSYLETYQDDPVFGDPARFLHNLRDTGPLAHAALSGIDVGMTPTDHELSVGRTFTLSLARLNPDDLRAQLARALLARAAYLAPGEPFSADLLAVATQEGDIVRPALIRLADLGLMRQEYGVLRIHRLVAEFARAALLDGAARGDVRRALTEQTAQAYGQRDVVVARQLLPHLTLHADAEQLPAHEEAVALWNAMPFLLELGGDLTGGLAYLQRAYTALLQDEIIETALGAEVLNNLAEWHRALGDPAAARPLHEQALTIRQTLLAPDDLQIGESQLNLGEALREEGLLDEARQAYERALAIGLQSGGPRNEITLAARNQLALLLFTLEHYAEARSQFEALIVTTSEVFGADDPRTATVHNNLATTLARLGDYEQASAEFAVVVAHMQSRLGEEHPDTLRVRLNAARALVECDALAEGIDELRQIVNPLTTAYGADHPVTRSASETLAEAAARLQAERDAAT